MKYRIVPYPEGHAQLGEQSILSKAECRDFSKRPYQPSCRNVRFQPGILARAMMLSGTLLGYAGCEQQNGNE
jgi:hypothetical protein